MKERKIEMEATAAAINAINNTATPNVTRFSKKVIHSKDRHIEHFLKSGKRLHENVKNPKYKTMVTLNKE